MELKILDWIQALHNPVTDVLFVWITRLGNVGMIWILLAAVLLFRRYPGGSPGGGCPFVQWAVKTSVSPGPPL